MVIEQEIPFDLQVPHFLVAILKFLRENLETEGLFRKAGSAGRQKNMRVDIEEAESGPRLIVSRPSAEDREPRANLGEVDELLVLGLGADVGVEQSGAQILGKFEHVLLQFALRWGEEVADGGEEPLARNHAAVICLLCEDVKDVL